MSELAVRRDGDVLELVISRQQRRNALSRDVLAALGHAVDEAPHDVRAIVLTGASGTFSAGADLNEIEGTAGDASFDEALDAVAHSLRSARQPVVAAIEGACVGAAIQLALACDIRIAGAGAFFELPATKLGLLYNPAAVASMRAVLPRQTLARLLLASERLDARAAMAAGLVAAVVPGGFALSRARRIARAVVGDPDAVAETKRLLEALDGGEDWDPAEWEDTRMRLLDSPARAAAVAAARDRHVRVGREAG